MGAVNDRPPFVADQSYVDKLRAAMYPALVSYCERTFTTSGRTYVVPYITVVNNCRNDGTQMYYKGKDDHDRLLMTTTFYLNKNGRIGVMTGTIKQMYEVRDFSSRDAVRRYMGELERSFKERIRDIPRYNRKEIENEEWKPVEEFLAPYAMGKKPIGDPEQLMKDFMRVHKNALGGDTEDLFLNIKTGESVRTVIRNDRKEVRMDGPDWYKSLDVTECVENGIVQRRFIAGEFERQRPGSSGIVAAKAMESLAKVSGKILRESGLELRGERYVDTEGEDDFLNNDFSI